MLELQHATFRAWAEERGVKINGLNVAKLPGKGIGVVATRKLKVIPTFIQSESAELFVLTPVLEERSLDLGPCFDVGYFGFEICPRAED
jgi:hypothetical protein